MVRRWQRNRITDRYLDEGLAAFKVGDYYNALGGAGKYLNRIRGDQARLRDPRRPDALLAYATLSLIATKSNVIASILGSLSAAVACEHDGNNPVAPEDVLKKLNALEKRAHFE